MAAQAQVSTWHFRGFAKDGAAISGVIDAQNREAALATLKTRGLILHRLDTAETGWRQRFQSYLPSTTTLSRQELHELLRDLATLLTARLPIDEALSTLEASSGSKRRSTALKAIRADIADGGGLAEALSGLPGMPGFVVGMTRAGEASGDLGLTLGRLAESMARALTLRQALQSALTYPLILLAVTAISLLVIMTVVVPSLKPLLQGAGAAIPLTARILVWISDLLANQGDILAVGMTVALLALLLWLRRAPAREALARWSLRLPLIGSLQRKGETAIVCRTLGTLIEAGAPLPEALEIAGSAARNAAFGASFVEIRDRVREGAELSAEFKRIGILAPAAGQFAAVGERSGRLAAMLLVAADTLEQETQRQSARLVALISPIMTVGLGGIVALVVISILSAVMSVNDLAF